MAYSVFVMIINIVLAKYLLFPDEATVLAKPVGKIYKFLTDNCVKYCVYFPVLLTSFILKNYLNIILR